MFVDTRNIPHGSTVASDICVVGAGAAGITVALELARSGFQVCLVESGGVAPTATTQSLAEGNSIGAPYSSLDSSQLRFFGGNTNAWGGWFRGLDDIDFRQRPWVDESGWPFDAQALSPYAKRVHEICEISCHDYSVERSLAETPASRAQTIPFDPARVETALYRFSPPTRFGRHYRSAIARSPSIKCLLHAHALKIETGDYAQHVVAVEVGCLGAGRLKVTAQVFVLAAGAIENARLLLLSNDVASGGIGNGYDLVGRYFMDHPHTRRTLIPGPRHFAFGLYGLGFRRLGISAGLSIAPPLQRKERLLNYKASIYPIYYGESSPAWEGFRDLMLKVGRKWRIDPYDRTRLPFARKTLTVKQLARLAFRPDQVFLGALSYAFNPTLLIRGLVLESKPEQAPNRASRVTLDDSRDDFGLPRARVDWRLLPIDWHTVIRSEEIIDEELRRIGIGQLAPLTEEERAGWPAGFTGGWHQIGTTRLHPDPRHGVVDANCKVHGTANLFVAGASIFPTGGAVSPMPTLLSLALRLADHVKNILQQPIATDDRQRVRIHAR